MDSEIEIDYILKFLDLNREKIYLPKEKIGSHAICPEAKDKILKNINSSGLDQQLKTDSIFFIEKLFSIIRYIPFDQFIKTIQIISLEIIKLLNDSQYNTVYFVASGIISKSNTWILLLFLDQLKTFIKLKQNIKYFVCADIKTVYQNCKNNNDLEETVFFCFDDMIYSGNQMASSLPNTMPKLDEVEQTDQKKSFKLKNNEYNNPGSGNKFDNIYLCAPYITTNGLGHIKKTCPTIKEINNEKILNFKEAFLKDEDGDNEEIKKKKQNIYEHFCTSQSYLQCHNDICAVYFDHKIADEFSVFKNFFYYGIYPVSSKEECKYTQVIKNCNNSSTFDETFCLLQNDLNTFNKSNQTDACPITFYKTISYLISSDEILDNADYDIVQIGIKINKKLSPDEHLSKDVKNKYLKYKLKYILLKNKLKFNNL